MSGPGASEEREAEMTPSASDGEKMPTDPVGLITEESAQARFERLGRERPAKFKSAWQEICFVFSIVMSQILAVSMAIALF